MLRIKEILKEKKMTAKELAATIGMTETGLSLIVKGNGNPPLNTLKKIADGLGVPVSALFTFPQVTFLTCPHCGKPIEVAVNVIPLPEDKEK